MPDYTIRDPQSGKTLTVRGDSPPTEAELTQLFAAAGAAPPATAAVPKTASQLGTLADRAKGALELFASPATQVRGQMPDLVKGAAEGALSTARGVAGMLPQGVQDAMSRGRQALGLPSVASLTTPANTAQKVGKAAEQMGEFFVPGAVLEHVLPAAGTAARMLTMAGSNALFSKAQGAGPVGTAVSAALGAAGQIPRTATALTDAAASRIEKTVLRGTTKDYANGFNPSNVFKYDLGGSPLETYAKATDKLNALGQEMKGVLQSVPDAAPVDMSAVNAKVLSSYRNNPEAAAALDRINKAVMFELNGQGIMPKLAGPGQIALDLPDANKAKQAVGQLGAWLTDPKGQVLSDADHMTEQVANRYYAALKQTILENAKGAGPQIQALNRQMADIIPIKTAAWRRFPVADRQNVVSLLDAIGVTAALHAGNPLPASAAIVNRLSKSGSFANALAKGIGLNQQVAQGAAAGATALSSSQEQQ